MRIGVVSDTHGHVPFTLAAIERLRCEQVACVLHCGDIGTPAIVPLFEPWPTYFVLGNVDAPFELSRAILDAGQRYHGRFGELEFLGVKIALLHGDDGELLRNTIDSRAWNVVCHGHTHVARRDQVGPTLVLNPGAVYRASPRSLATLDLETLAVVHHPLE